MKRAKKKQVKRTVKNKLVKRTKKQVKSVPDIIKPERRVRAEPELKTETIKIETAANLTISRYIGNDLKQEYSVELVVDGSPVTDEVCVNKNCVRLAIKELQSILERS